ncbi:acyl- N-acyltransferase protein [Rutstroemia sp. NJR-2017a BBW]|nr:acyl- N-acyltransferase protein [Rutstroemia sp. NJR-2017a BBW]
MELKLRKATIDDIPSLHPLIEASVRGLQASHYTPAQITGALKSVYGVDTQLIQDGNYFVVTSGGEEIVASGGISFRATLYGGDQFASRDSKLLDPEVDGARIRAFFVHPDWTRKGIAGMIIKACESAAREKGFRRAEIGSTLSGVMFYEKMGYEALGRSDAQLDDGLVLEIVKMGKSLE